MSVTAGYSDLRISPQWPWSCITINNCKHCSLLRILGPSPSHILIYEWWDLRVYGKMVLFTKTPRVKHEDWAQVRAVRSWHSHPGSLTAFFWQRAETEEMWEAGTDVFFNGGFPMIEIFFFLCVCVLYVFCLHAFDANACFVQAGVRQAAFSCPPAQLNPLVPVQACYYCCISMLMEASIFCCYINSIKCAYMLVVHDRVGKTWLK